MGEYVFMLDDVRILDLCDERGMFAGYLLAHLGADVLAVEPPGGSSIRRLAPFAGPDGATAQQSLWWWAYGRGKRSCSLDLQSAPDRQRLVELADQADVFIESFPPGELAALGIDLNELMERNPRLVVATITPFGSTGPKASWPATDLTVWAASGTHSLAGDADRAPVRTSVAQAFLHAGADAAGAVLIALHERDRSGRGQHIDLSAQQSSQQAALSTMLAIPNKGTPVRRMAGGLQAKTPIRLTWPCADGFVAITLLFGPAFREPNRRLLLWMAAHGGASAADAEVDWGSFMYGVFIGENEPDEYLRLCGVIEAFTITRTQAWLVEEGIGAGAYVAPTNTIPQLLAERHFHERGFWESVARPDGNATVLHPGAIAKLTATPLTPVGPAPSPGPAAWKSQVRALHAGPTSGSTAGSAAGSTDRSLARGQALDGLKVLDFMWVFAGPHFTRVLADYGATVVRVESTTRICPARPGGPFVNDLPGMHNGAPFLTFNAGKHGVTINPTHPAGRNLILRLVRWADVVTESFSPKAMKGWGLDYAALREHNPSLIMLSSALMGHSGPRSMVPGYGNMAAAFTGYYDLTGWPDRSPAGPYLAYTDAVSPRFMVAVTMAALRHRQRTGEGQHIDCSQAEAALHFLAPALLDQQVNQHTWTRMGNRDLDLAPHGVYPSLGDDRWIAIACQSNEAWTALCRVAGLGAMGTDPALATSAQRRLYQDQLDAALSAWTSAMSAEAAQEALVVAGVAAHVVAGSADCYADPQLLHRQHYVRVPHPDHGEVYVENSRWTMSATPSKVRWAGPTVGQHNEHVLVELLGLSDDELVEALVSGGLE